MKSWPANGKTYLKDTCLLPELLNIFLRHERLIRCQFNVISDLQRYVSHQIFIQLYHEFKENTKRYILLKKKIAQ